MPVEVARVDPTVQEADQEANREAALKNRTASPNTARKVPEVALKNLKST